MWYLFADSLVVTSVLQGAATPGQETVWQLQLLPLPYIMSSALLMNSSCHKPTVEWNLIIKALCSLRSWHKIHYMTAWQMVYLLTWTPGVKEQDKLNPPRLPQGQGVAAYRCVRGTADGQGHHVPRGADDSGTPAGSVNVGRQTKGRPGAILLRGLRTCM